MSNQRQSFMQFRALGTNCADCGFSLTGSIYKGGAEICQRIEEELKGGTLCIEISDSNISFVFEGISIGFIEKPERLSAISKMLELGMNLHLEPFVDSNNKGFALMAGG